MEYKTLSPGQSLPTGESYPRKLLERMKEDPPTLYFSGPFGLLGKFTLGVLCSDDSDGLAFMGTHQALHAIREYDMNYLSPSHSVLETEIFRLGLYRKNTTVSVMSAKGLAGETFEDYLLDRFYPPLHEFPEREEYFRRAVGGELLMLSLTDPAETRTAEKNLRRRSLACAALSDAVFIPYAHPGSRTLWAAKKILGMGVPLFTAEYEGNESLRALGVPAFGRKTVGKYLEGLGARLPTMVSSVRETRSDYVAGENDASPPAASVPRQGELGL